MTNVVSIGTTREFLAARAARHRRAGRYDEAMLLLTRAREEFGFHAETELECARIYDEIGFEDEAVRCYLRVVRMGGSSAAQALFHLALTFAGRGETSRAASYYQQFASMKQDAVPQEMAVLLGKQLLEEIEAPVSRSRKARARRLERRAAQYMQQGRTAAAKRAVEHAVALEPTSQNYTLLACCNLLREEAQEAVRSAESAHRIAPAKVQTLCVLADAYMAAGEDRRARRAVYLAFMRARSVDDLLAAAIESAKHGEDLLTLRLTAALLRREPFHIRAIQLRACALMNLGKCRQAARLFGRLCGLLPDDTVCEYYYRQALSDQALSGKLGLGMDVPREEGVARAKELLEMLYVDPKDIAEDSSRLRRVVRLCGWALHSPMAGGQVKTVALILLGALETDEARCMLEDLLVQPQVDESMKMAVLQMLTGKEGFKPYHVDIGGQLVRLAAGGISDRPARGTQANSRVVQRAADAVSGDFPDAPKMMLDLYLAYLKRYKEPDKREEETLAAALEYVYHLKTAHEITLALIARRNGVSRRRCGIYVRRLIACNTTN